MNHLDIHEQEQIRTEAKRIAELKARRDYWLSKSSAIAFARMCWYADYIHEIEDLPF